MSTAPVSPTSVSQQLETFVQERQTDLRLLAQALQTGNLATAQHEFNAIQNAAKSQSSGNGNTFQNSQPQQYFSALGKALQAADLTGAQQALTQLESTFRAGGIAPAQSPGVAPAARPTAAEPEITLNLGALSAGQEVTIGLNTNAANGGEQITVSIANQQNPSPEQITFNLQKNTNEQIVLNFGASETSAPGKGLNVAA